MEQQQLNIENCDAPKRRILALIPKHPKIMAMKTASEIRSVADFETDDQTLTAALSEAIDDFRRSQPPLE